MAKRILVADDEPAVRQLLELVLRGQGYDVLLAQNGDQLVRMAQTYVPDLVLVDLMMPQMDGYEAIRQLRNDTRTAHLPTIILTAKSTPDDVVIGFETGADDYIIKPFNIPELLARVKGQLRRAAQQPVRSPLTGLSGNVLLTEELKYRFKNGAPFASIYVDLDNFKAFNDTYGPARGDRVIKLVAEVLTQTVQKYGTGTDFIGHIGGDDFAVLTSPDVVDTLCTHFIDVFDQRVRSLYDPDDLARGYLHGTDRQGVARRFPIISVSIGVVTNRYRMFTDHEEISRVAAEMKQYAKQQSGSSYAVDVRGTRDGYTSSERRGSNIPGLLILSDDDGLRKQMQQALHEAGYRVLESPGVPEAHAILSREIDLGMLVADARLGDTLWEMVRSIHQLKPILPIVIVSNRSRDEETAAEYGARAFVLQPFPIQQLLQCVSQIMKQ